MRLITHIKASNLLSFGPEGLDLELQDLNVLIGPNGSGKSNFLEIFEVLRALPRNVEDSNNIERIISKSGGREEWAWKGGKELTAFIQVYVLSRPNKHLKHEFKLDLEFPFGGFIFNEYIENYTTLQQKVSSCKRLVFNQGVH